MFLIFLFSYPPTIQVLFAYAFLPASELSSSSSSVNPPSPSLSLSSSASFSHTTTVKRRLRVHTVQVPVARSAHDIYKSADADTIISLLTHKVLFFLFHVSLLTLLFR